MVILYVHIYNVSNIAIHIKKKRLNGKYSRTDGRFHRDIQVIEFVYKLHFYSIPFSFSLFEACHTPNFQVFNHYNDKRSKLNIIM